MSRGRRNLLVAAGVAAAVIAADQVSKAAITAALGPTGDRTVIWVVPRVLRLLYVRNTGVAFGMFQGAGPVLTVLAVAVVVVLGIVFRRMIRESLWLSLALGLQFGGAIGNIIDRLRLGHVVDFIDVLRFPTFNVADSAITIGVFMLGFSLLRSEVDASTRGTSWAAIDAPGVVAPGVEDGGPGSTRHPSG